MTAPAQETSAVEAVTDAALAAYAEHERIRCNVGTGGDLSQCGCICGEVLAACRPHIHAEHRRAHVAAAIVAALTPAESVLAAHQKVSWGIGAGSPDKCRCGAEIYPTDRTPDTATAEDEISLRRGRAFAAHQVAALTADASETQP